MEGEASKHQGRERQRMEERLGEVGTGLTELTINGHCYDLYQLLRQVGMDYEDIRPIDAHALDADSFVIRFFDLEERVIVGYEFDATFAYLREQRVHIDEWMGEDYYNFPWAIHCPESL